MIQIWESTFYLCDEILNVVVIMSGKERASFFITLLVLICTIDFDCTWLIKGWAMVFPIGGRFNLAYIRMLSSLLGPRFWRKFRLLCFRPLIAGSSMLIVKKYDI